MPWIGGAISAGGSILGGMMGADAAGDAAAMQAESTRAGIAEQRRQYDLTRRDNAPMRAGGTAAMEKLRAMMGLTGVGTGGMPSKYQFMRPVGGGAYNRYYYSLIDAGYSPAEAEAEWASGDGSGFQLDENAYNAAVANAKANADPQTGELTKKFTIDDFWKDPVVQLGYTTGKEAGEKALKNAAPLTFGMDSGAAIKEAIKFGTDYTGLKGGESRDRFVGDQNTAYNRLMGFVAPAQQSLQTTAQAGSNMANNVSGMLTAQGNAAGAGRIAGANAWSGAMNNLSNWWQQKNFLDRAFPQTGSTPGYNRALANAWQMPQD